MLFTGRTIDAPEACAWGLVSRVTPPERLLGDALEALTACCRSAPQARLVVKRVINESYGRYDRMSMDESLSSPECVEGWVAFKERRSPSWVPEELRTEGRL
jgi:enoyl-CoA hydratase/carnithine racemase